MKKFLIYIKSHADAPDYEDTCLAKNKEEAAKIFAVKINRAGGDWYPSGPIDYIEEEE